MNPTSDETEAIRSEIDTTRRRMDDTIDALGERFKGRHLIDEVLGFLRNDTDRTRDVGRKLSQTASTAMNSITNTVKTNPAPVLLIGAGVAWMIYNSRREPSFSDDDEFYGEPDSGYPRMQTDPDIEAHYDRPLDYPSSATMGTSADLSPGDTFASPALSAAGGSSKLGSLKDKVTDKASAATQQVKQRLSDVGSRVRERSGMAGQHAREIGSRVQQRARDTYRRSRARVVDTADRHPLELGLACLAAGVIAGLVMRTPERLNRLAGPSVDRLRERTREAGDELMHKGRRVANAAAEAAKAEAQTQGLTPDQLLGHAEETQGQPAASENSPTGQPSLGQRQNQPSGAGQSQPQPDPLASRPVM